MFPKISFTKGLGKNIPSSPKPSAAASATGQSFRRVSFRNHLGAHWFVHFERHIWSTRHVWRTIATYGPPLVLLSLRLNFFAGLDDTSAQLFQSTRPDASIFERCPSPQAVCNLASGRRTRSLSDAWRLLALSLAQLLDSNYENTSKQRFCHCSMV